MSGQLAYVDAAAPAHLKLYRSLGAFCEHEGGDLSDRRQVPGNENPISS